ncbi:cytochrome bd oxidase small subunit CydS [Mesobacillus subterraneus]
MEEFLMFYAPFLVIISSIIASFWLAGKDERVE